MINPAQPIGFRRRKERRESKKTEAVGKGKIAKPIHEK
jgi:hypothetical protein